MGGVAASDSATVRGLKGLPVVRMGDGGALASSRVERWSKNRGRERWTKT